MARMDILSLLTTVVLIFAIFGFSAISGHPDHKNGMVGTTSTESRISIVSYELSRGEKIRFEWESNSNVAVVITTDPVHPQLAEFANVTGLTGKETFVSPAKATYYIRVIFLEIPPNTDARITYNTYRITEFSELMASGKPAFLGILTLALTGLLSWNWRMRRTRIQTEGEMGSISFWNFFVEDYKNWLAVVIGSLLLVFCSLLISVIGIDVNHSYVIDLLGYLGSGILFWGTIFGLFLSYGNYLKDRRVQNYPRAKSQY